MWEKCDCIEATINKNGCKIPAVEFPVSLLPIEYKHGTVRDEMEYKIQLLHRQCVWKKCIRHVFLKENCFYFVAQKKREVELDKSLRNEVQKMAIELRKNKKQIFNTQSRI